MSKSKKKKRKKRPATGPAPRTVARGPAASADSGGAETASAGREASRSSRLALGAVLMVAVAAAVVVGVSSLTRNAELSPDPELPAAGESVSGARDGHARMLERLAEIRALTPEVNHWQGDRAALEARRYLDALPESASPQRFEVLLDVAEHELRLGNDRQAIGRFEQAVEVARQLRGQLAEPDVVRALFRTGVAYLRYGETLNCAQRHNARSCILPIRGDGIHVDQEGSRKAIEYFQMVLGSTPETSPLHIKTVWLLNLAYMTVGEYPDGVPESLRLPARVLESQQPFRRFENVAPDLGLGSFNLSGGAVLDDFDGDDDLDLFTTTFDAEGEPRFFENLGDGSFVDATAESNLKGLFGGLNLVHADYDNDGDLDVYVLRGAWLASAGRHPNSLLRNDGTGRFTDVTFEAGLGELELPTQTAAWADYDNDGDLDLYVGNEHGAPPSGYGTVEEPFDAPSQLFRNNGDGTFVDVAESAGVQLREFVKGTVWGDYDDDRYPDLYVSILGGENRLFRNNRDGTFSDVAADLDVQRPLNSFPVWFWDFDNDGALDLFVPSYRGSEDGVALVVATFFGLEVPYEMPALYRGSGGGAFQEVARARGLDRLHLPMGSNFGDVDNDGYLDFYLGTGYPDYEGLMPNVLYRNVGGERFADVTLAAGLGHLQKGHAVSFADYDADGDLDLFAQMGGAFPGDKFSDALFENPGFDNGWLGLRLVGDQTNRSAIGARIEARIVEDGVERSIHRVVGSGGSFGCNPLRQTIGVGRAERVERLEIYWPTSDTRQVFEDVAIDRAYRLVEGSELASL